MQIGSQAVPGAKVFAASLQCVQLSARSTTAALPGKERCKSQFFFVILKPLPVIVQKEQLVHRSDAAKFSPVSRQEKAPIRLLVIPLVLKIDQPFGSQNYSVVRSLEAVVILASKHLQLCHLI